MRAVIVTRDIVTFFTSTLLTPIGILQMKTITIRCQNADSNKFLHPQDDLPLRKTDAQLSDAEDWGEIRDSCT